MQRFVVLIILCALSAGQVRVPSSYNNGVKWEFGANLFRADVLARSNVDQVPTVYKKELIAPIARREPAVAAVYKNPEVTDVYKKPVLPTVYKKEYVVQNVRQHQSVIPPVFNVHSVHSNIYKSEPVVQNVYKQQAAVPIVRKTHPVVSNVYQFKGHPIQPAVHLPPLWQDFVPKVLAINSEKQRQPWNWNYQYNPHHALVHDGIHVIPNN